MFNSFHTGLSKRDPAAFDDAVRRLGADPGRVLFVDDHPGNVARAEARGLLTLRYTDRDAFVRSLSEYCPILRETFDSEGSFLPAGTDLSFQRR